MSEDLDIRSAADGSTEQAVIIGLVEVLRAATRDMIDYQDPDAVSRLMTATAVFSGTLFGSMIIAGVAVDGDRRRAADAMARNFRSGVEVGKRRTLRLYTDAHGGRA